MTHEGATTRPAIFLGFFLGCILVAATAAGAGTLGVVPSADGTPTMVWTALSGIPWVLEFPHNMGGY